MQTCPVVITESGYAFLHCSRFTTSRNTLRSLVEGDPPNDVEPQPRASTRPMNASFWYLFFRKQESTIFVLFCMHEFKSIYPDCKTKIKKESTTIKNHLNGRQTGPTAVLNDIARRRRITAISFVSVSSE